MTARKGESGFTLLELLVALVILGFIVVGLSSGTQLEMTATGAQAVAEAQQQDLQPVDALLRRVVEGIALPGDPQQPGLVGARDGFLCVTNDPAPGAAGPTPRVDAALVTDSAHRLLLRWSPHLHGERLEPRPPPNQEVLLQGVAGLDVAYSGPNGWVAAWNRADLPALIRIRLVFVPGDKRRWPSIVMATRQTRNQPSVSG